MRIPNHQRRTDMTPDELRAAAERQAKFIRDEWGPLALVAPLAVECLAVLDRVVADHPADDAEPVTAAWLESVGCREPHDMDYSAPPTMTSGVGYGVLVQASATRWDWCRGARVIATNGSTYPISACACCAQ